MLIVRFGRRIQKTRQFLKCFQIDIPFEFDHDIKRHPVFMPPPCVEFRCIGQPQIDVGIPAEHPQQKPYLLLSPIVPPDFTPDKMGWYFITQPVPCPSDYLDMFLPQTGFFLQFTVHGLFRRFAIFDAALRKLPRLLTDTFSPPHLIVGIEQNNTDVGAVTFTVQHVSPQSLCKMPFSQPSFCHFDLKIYDSYNKPPSISDVRANCERICQLIL